jgi:hypothetical protein
MSDYDHVMIDIETMSTHPNNALILSIGLVEFDPTPDKAPRIGNRTLLRPEIIPQLLLGRHVDPKTQKWWMDQSHPAIDDWALGERQDFLTVHSVVSSYTRDKKGIWANGDLFDLGNLASLILQLRCDLPWHYRAPRCMRGFMEGREQTRMPSMDDTPLDTVAHVPHAALDDCLRQIQTVWAHWPVRESVMHHSV